LNPTRIHPDYQAVVLKQSTLGQLNKYRDYPALEE
jgi:hypothetical protein